MARKVQARFIKTGSGREALLWHLPVPFLSSSLYPKRNHRRPVHPHPTLVHVAELLPGSDTHSENHAKRMDCKLAEFKRRNVNIREYRFH